MESNTHATDTNGDSQAGVEAWFDKTYRELGFDYLRPADAYPVFLQLLGAEPGKSLLDVACGPGLLLKEASDKGLQVHGVDLAEAAVELARRYVPAAKVDVGNAQEIDYPDGHFDYVTCIAAIERFFDRPAALREFHRLGKASARYCFMVRNASTLVWRIYRQALGKQNVSGHQDALEYEEWQALFEEQGFQVDDVYVDQWPRQRLRRILRFGRRLDRSRPEAIAKPLLPMRYANEFIFLLSKRPGS